MLATICRRRLYTDIFPTPSYTIVSVGSPLSSLNVSFTRRCSLCLPVIWVRAIPICCCAEAACASISRASYTSGQRVSSLCCVMRTFCRASFDIDIFFLLVINKRWPRRPALFCSEALSILAQNVGCQWTFILPYSSICTVTSDRLVHTQKSWEVIVLSIDTRFSIDAYPFAGFGAME